MLFELVLWMRMNRLGYYALNFTMSGGFTVLSYSALKHSRYGVILGVAISVISTLVWLHIARGIRCPNELLATGFYMDIAGKFAGISIPFLMFGVRADPRTMLGLGLMVAGTLVWK